MKLNEWHEIRDRILVEQTPIRLDCLNPFYALSSWRCVLDDIIATPGELLDQFRNTFVVDPVKNIVLTKGVRSFLRSAMISNWGQSSSWIFPADVFPAYKEIAKETKVSFSEVTTWPMMNFNISAKPNSPTILLLPVPHSPTGKDLTGDDLNEVVSWLKHSPMHYVVLDLVYAYTPLQPSVLMTLLQSSPNVLAAYSISKTWLQRCLAGFADIPSKLFDDISAHCESPLPQECGLAVRCLRDQPTLPEFQNQCFKNKWLELLPEIYKASPQWNPPQSGYLSTIELPWNILLENHGILGVPPALFGSSATGFTIISCLHDLVTNEP